MKWKIATIGILFGLAFACFISSWVLFAVLITKSVNDQGIQFESFIKENDTTYSIVVPNEMSKMDFNDVVLPKSPFTDWTLSAYDDGRYPITNKTALLAEGNNTFYVTITGEDIVYTLQIRRRPLYTVTFDLKGGTTNVNFRFVEEGQLLLPPNDPVRNGFTFVGWDFDFEAPIMQAFNINAIWVPNANKYLLDRQLSFMLEIDPSTNFYLLFAFLLYDVFEYNPQTNDYVDSGRDTLGGAYLNFFYTDIYPDYDMGIAFNFDGTTLTLPNEFEVQFDVGTSNIFSWMNNSGIKTVSHTNGIQIAEYNVTLTLYGQILTAHFAIS